MNKIIKIIEEKTAPNQKTTLTIYKVPLLGYRWKIKHKNGNVISSCSEYYKNLADLRSNLKLITKTLLYLG